MVNKIYTKECLSEAAKKSCSFSELCDIVGCGKTGNSYQRIKRLLRDFDIDVKNAIKKLLAELTIAKDAIDC